MIWYSVVWKEELEKEILSFTEFINKMEDFETAYFYMHIEKFHFITAFIIRKLIEGNKLSQGLISKSYSCAKYKRINLENRIDHLNSHHFERFYDLNSPEDFSMNIRQITNLFIHSFTFMPTFDEDLNKITGIFVNTDFTKEEGIFHFDFEVIVSVIKDVIDDEIVKVEYKRG